MKTFRTAVLLYLSAAFFAVAANSTHVIYVNINNTNGGQNGTSWALAYDDLQSALDDAALRGGSNDIWIAQGTYVPTKIYAPSNVNGGECFLDTKCTGTESGLRTFDLPDNTALYGGFKGDELTTAQRKVKKHETILSGNDISWHVVTLGNDVAETGVTAKLDGITIAHGNAQGPSYGADGFASLTSPFEFLHSNGGGVYVTFDSNLNVFNSMFVDNVANAGVGQGGALFSSNSDIYVSTSWFKRNSAQSGGAAWVFNTFEEDNAHLSEFYKTDFQDNRANIFGGALVGEGVFPALESKMRIVGSSFKHNEAAEGGGSVVDSLNVEIESSDFIENIGYVSAGGFAMTAVVNFLASALHNPQLELEHFHAKISGSHFLRNEAHGDLAIHDNLLGGLAAGFDFPLGGGAVVSYMDGIVDISQTTFTGNKAINGPGGAILNGRAAAEFLGMQAYQAEVSVHHCLFDDNYSSNSDGGAIASLPSPFFSGNPSPYSPINFTTDDLLVAIDHTKFVANRATNRGGAIYLEVTDATLDTSHFRKNRADIGNNVYAIDSILNGSDTNPIIIPQP